MCLCVMYDPLPNYGNNQKLFMSLILTECPILLT